MATIQDNINRIKQAKADIKEAIIAKGGTLAEDAKLSEFKEAVEGLPSGGASFEEIMTDDNGRGVVGIEQVIVNEGVTSLTASAYKGMQIVKIQLPYSLNIINSGCFENCTLLNEVIIRDNVTKIGPYAFKGLFKLTKLNLPKKLQEIGMQAFMGAGFTEGLHLPQGVTKIPIGCFNNCSKLPSLIFDEHTAIPTLDNINAFQSTPCKFIVPDALYDEWVSATNWSTYADRIIKASEYTES